MDTRLTKSKLTGVVKAYKKKASTSSQLLASRTLTTITNKKRNMKIDMITTEVKSLLKEQNRNIDITSRVTPKESSSIVTKAAEPTNLNLNVQKPKSKPKFSKWDIKGRLGYTQELLTDSKNRLKKATMHTADLTAELSDLIEKENNAKQRAAEAEEFHDRLVKDRDMLTTSKEKLEESSVSLKKTVDRLKADLCETTRSLDYHKEKYKNHDSKMLCLFNDIERVQRENMEHEETIMTLKERHQELEIALSGIQEKRQEMLKTLRLLKGDD
ncbi:myosin-3-like [Athalia rosae]|uniref:myosin-3-like n=1 Tax=Athalia rosae TaxID=37344 RepID=UPI0020333E24|nr:myosin-3-like [Athalia rosae]